MKRKENREGNKPKGREQGHKGEDKSLFWTGS
jgi:hypothetical protein